MNNTENMKNMVVLKNLPSNIVEEAIVILKPNIKLKKADFVENKKQNKKAENTNIKNSKKYIVNEAEMIVSNYLSKLENDKKNNIKTNRKIEIKYKRLKTLSVILGIMLFVSVVIR